MLVSKDDGVNDPNLFPEELGSQIGGSVDQQIAFWKAQNGTAAGSLVLWISSLADGAAAPNGWDANRGARPQQDHFVFDARRDWLFLHHLEIGLRTNRGVGNMYAEPFCLQG